jgi:Na+/proline symporter
MLFWYVIAYWVVSVAIGLIASLKVKNATDFAAAGHSLPMYVVTATVFATWFGAEAVLGAPATFLNGGLAAVVADPFGSSLCLILVGLFFAKPLYQKKFLTIGDFYREKYGRTVEILITLCIAASYLGWVSAQIMALGLVFHVASEGAISQNTGMLIGSGSVLIYTTAIFV